MFIYRNVKFQEGCPSRKKPQTDNIQKVQKNKTAAILIMQIMTNFQTVSASCEPRICYLS